MHSSLFLPSRKHAADANPSSLHVNGWCFDPSGAYVAALVSNATNRDHQAVFVTVRETFPRDTGEPSSEHSVVLPTSTALRWYRWMRNFTADFSLVVCGVSGVLWIYTPRNEQSKALLGVRYQEMMCGFNAASAGAQQREQEKDTVAPRLSPLPSVAKGRRGSRSALSSRSKRSSRSVSSKTEGHGNALSSSGSRRSSSSSTSGSVAEVGSAAHACSCNCAPHCGPCGAECGCYVPQRGLGHQEAA